MKILRNLAIIGVIVALFAVVIMNSSTRQAPADQVWHPETTVGSLQARNYYVMYTDLMCPYCDVFSRNILEHWDDFEQFLAENDILFEIRLTDMLYEGSGAEYSRWASEAGYCAIYEGKFWEYYHGALTALWNDYQSKGYGSSKTAPTIKNLPTDYFLQIGKQAGLGAEFEQCIQSHAAASELDYDTGRAASVVQGLPFFKFNDFTNAGFDTNWGWDYVKLYLNAGLEK